MMDSPRSGADFDVHVRNVERSETIPLRRVQLFIVLLAIAVGSGCEPSCISGEFDTETRMEDTSARHSALQALGEKGIPFAATSSKVCFRFEDRDAVSNALFGLVDFDKYECSQQLSAERERLFRETLDKHGIPWVKDRYNTCIERRLGDEMQPVWHDFYTVVLPTREMNPPEIPSHDAALDWTHGYSTKVKDIADSLARFLETNQLPYGQSRSMDSYVVYWRTDDPEEISMIIDDH